MCGHLYMRGTWKKAGANLCWRLFLAPVSNIHLLYPFTFHKTNIPSSFIPSSFTVLLPLSSILVTGWALLQFTSVARECSGCPRLVVPSSGGESWRTTPSLPLPLFCNQHSNWFPVDSISDFDFWSTFARLIRPLSIPRQRCEVL